MTAVIDGQLSIFDWMEDFDHAKEATTAAGLPEQIEEPEVGQWVYKTGAPIPHIMRRSYIGKKVLMDKSTQSMTAFKVGILERVDTSFYYHGDQKIECDRSVIYDGSRQRSYITHMPGQEIYECLPWHSYQKREESIFGPVRSPCGRRCKYEWGSKRCFESRGQIYDYHERKWLKDENGKPVIGKKICDWEPGKGQ